MKAILALVFFACIAGSMANTPGQLVGQIVQQGQAVAQAVIGQLQSQVSALIQGALGQLSALVGSLGGRLDFGQITEQLQNLLASLTNTVLTQILGGLPGLIGGMSF